MKRIAAFFAFAQLAFISGICGPVAAQDMTASAGHHRSVTTQSWVEEWDPVQARWVKVAEDSANAAYEGNLPTIVTTVVGDKVVSETRSAARYAKPLTGPEPAVALGEYGPFVVTAPGVALMMGSTNARSPQDFDAMLRDFPGIRTLEMVEAPGTNNDIANLALGRKIREAGISTHVPSDGSVRSGAVELFLAGQTRSIDDGAEFAVHSWLDNHGREADDFAANHPTHRLYLDYYVEMGMSEEHARKFYAMTNSVPHASALWLEAQEMRGWIAPKDMPTTLFAARQMDAICTFCERVQKSLNETNTRLAALPLDMPLEVSFEAPLQPITLNTVQPVIGYGDVTDAKLAWAATSLLDS